MDKPIRLYEESFYLKGAMDMLHTLRGAYNLVRKGKDENVYVEAELDLICNSMDDVRDFISGRKIAYRNWECDKKGRLIKCEAYWWK